MVTPPGHATLLIDGARCVHGLSAVARCARCVAACPHGALVLTQQSLGFDEDACTGCGLCRPVCPEAAIELGRVRFDSLVDRRRGEALLACAKAAPYPSRGTVPCLHAVAERDLARLSDDAVRVIVTARGDCAGCENATSATLEQRIATLNRLAASRGGDTLAVREAGAAEWAALQSRAHACNNDLDHGRRALFGAILRREPAAGARSGEPGAQALVRYAPRIDIGACVGCDACARICPHGAIALKRDGAGLHYALAPERCTGCGLCEDVCADKAVRIEEIAGRGEVRVALYEQRCGGCGADFHATAAATGSTCRVCRGKAGAAKLFQVRP